MGRGPLWACLEGTLCSIIPNPSWDQPLGLEGCSPKFTPSAIPASCPALAFGKGKWIHQQPPFLGSKGSLLKPLPHLLSPTCAGALSQQLRAPARARSRRRVGGAWFHPLHPPVLAPSAAAPSSSRPPGRPPPSLPPAHPVLCLFSENQTRDWGEGEDPRRGSGI